MKKFLVLLMCIGLTGCAVNKTVEPVVVNSMESVQEIGIEEENEIKSTIYTFHEIETESIPLEVGALYSDICDVMGWVATDYNIGFPEFTIENMKYFSMITSDYRILYVVDKGVFDICIFDNNRCFNYKLDSDGNVEYIGETSRKCELGDNKLDKCVEECIKSHRLNIDGVEHQENKIVLNNYGDIIEYEYEDDEPKIRRLSYCDTDTENIIDIKY